MSVIQLKVNCICNNVHTTLSFDGGLEHILYAMELADDVHSVSFVKRDRQWYYCDDMCIKAVDRPPVQSHEQETIYSHPVHSAFYLRVQ